MEFDYALKLGLSKQHLNDGISTGLNSDDELVIRYEVPLAAGQGAKDWLKDNRKTINDEMVDHQKIEGIWRSVSIETKQATAPRNQANKEKVVIEQMFRKGWITSLIVDGATDWSEARAVQGSNVKEESAHGSYPAGDTTLNPQEYHTVQWEGVDPEAAHSIVDSLTALDATGLAPVINGEAIGTGFIRLKTTHDIPVDVNNKDRSATITMLFGKPRFSIQTTEMGGTDLATNSYFLFDVPSHMSQALIDLYETAGPYERVNVSAPNENGLVNIIFGGYSTQEGSSSGISSSSCRYVSTTTYYYGLDDPMDVPENEMGTTYDARFRIDYKNGLYSGTITKRQRETQHIEEWTRREDHQSTVSKEEWVGLYIIDDAYYNVSLSISGGTVTKSSALITLPTDALDAGETRGIEKGVNDDCTHNVTVDVAQLEQLVDVLEYDTHDDQDRHDHVVESINVDKDTSVTLTAGVDEILSANVRFDKKNGVVDIKELTSTPKNRDGKIVEARGDRITTKNTDSASPVQPSDAAQSVGSITRSSWEESAHLGRYKASEETILAVDQPKELVVNGHTHILTRTTHTQGNELPTQTPVAGHIIKATDAPTEFDKSRTLVEDIEAVDQTSTETISTHARVTTVEENTQNVAEVVAIDQSVLPVGSVSVARNKPTEFDLYNTRLEATTVTDQTSTDEQNTNARTTSTLEHTQGPAVTADAAGTGTISVASNTPTEYGLYNTKKTTVTAVDQTSTDAQNTSARTSSTVEHTQGPAVTADAASAGVISIATNTPTEFGLNNTRKTTVTAIDQTSTDEQKTHARTSSTVEHTQGPAVTADTPTEGVISVATNTPTEFGLNNTRKTTATAVDQPSDVEIVGHARTIAIEKHTQGPEVTSITAGALQRVSATNDPTEFGLNRTTKTIVTATDQEGSGSTADSSKTSVTETHTQAAAPITTVTATAGFAKTATSRPTEYGANATVERTVTALPQDTGWVAFSTKWGTSYYRRFSNLTSNAVSAPVSDLDAYSVSFNASLNSFGLYNGGGTFIATNSAYGVDWYRTHHNTKSTKVQRTHIGGVAKKKTIVYSHAHTTHATYSAAQAEVDGETNTSIRPISAGVWLATITTENAIGVGGSTDWVDDV